MIQKIYFFIFKIQKMLSRSYFSTIRIFASGISYFYKESSRYPYEIAIVTIIKDEADYIEEWIEYHKVVGIDRFYIYDNDSDDDIENKLEKYINTGIVNYIPFPGTAKQLKAYNHAIKHYKNECKYMAFIDADEFLVPMDREKTIPSIVKEILDQDSLASGVAVNWRMFGSSGYEKKPRKGGVLENFIYRASTHGKGNYCIKTIANPRKIFRYEHVHYPTYFLNTYSINEEGKKVSGWQNECEEPTKIRINHYFTKSKEEWINRRSKGKADTRNVNNKRTIEEFYEHDNNDVFDDYMLYFVEKFIKDK